MNNTKKCKYCNTDIDKGNKICPNCKKKQGFSTWIIAVIVMFFIFGSIGSNKNNIKNESLENNALAIISNDETSTKINTTANANIDTSEKTNTTPSASVNTSEKTNTTPSASVNTSEKTNTTSSASVDTSEKTNTTPSVSADTSKKTNTIPSTSVKPSTNQSNTIIDNKNYTVYITNTGKKYHSSGCRYLKQSCIKSTLNEAVASGLEPCSVCNP